MLGIVPLFTFSIAWTKMVEYFRVNSDAIPDAICSSDFQQETHGWNSCVEHTAAYSPLSLAESRLEACRRRLHSLFSYICYIQKHSVKKTIIEYVAVNRFDLPKFHQLIRCRGLDLAFLRPFYGNLSLSCQFFCINCINYLPVFCIDYRRLENGAILFYVCNFRSVDQIGTKFGTPFLTQRRNLFESTCKTKRRHIANDNSHNVTNL